MEVSRAQGGITYLNDAIQFAQSRLGGRKRTICRLDPSDRDLVLGITLIYKGLKSINPDLDKANPLIRRNIEQLTDKVGIPRESLQVQGAARRVLHPPSRPSSQGHWRPAPSTATRGAPHHSRQAKGASTSRPPSHAKRPNGSSQGHRRPAPSTATRSAPHHSRQTKGASTSRPPFRATGSTGFPSPASVKPPSLDANDPHRGIFGPQTILQSGKLGTKGIVEFFYSKEDVRASNHPTREQIKQAYSHTYGGRKQVDYACFANTAKGDKPLIIDGEKWISREHYFQAQKFRRGSNTYRMIQQGRGPFRSTKHLRKTLAATQQGPGQGAAIRQSVKHEAGKSTYDQDRYYTSSEEWDKVSFGIMYKANLAFFSQNPQARALLLSTGTAPIVERNNTPDRWGITFNQPINLTNNTNLNLQGSVLMAVRDQLRKQPGM